MASATYVGKMLKDGHLSLPKKARERLKLAPGTPVQVVVHTVDDQAPPDEAYAPLRALIGLGRGGREDGAVHHDKYLYGKEAT